MQNLLDDLGFQIYNAPHKIAVITPAGTHKTCVYALTIVNTILKVCCR